MKTLNPPTPFVVTKEDVELHLSLGYDLVIPLLSIDSHDRDEKVHFLTKVV